MSDREPRKVVVPYANLQKRIRCLLPESEIPVLPSLLPLKRLHETLCSMEPMVYDLEQSESLKETRHKDTAEFLSLVNEAKISTGRPFNSNFTVKKKLESIRKRMKNLFRNYVEAELVAELSEVADEQVKMELQRLVSYLRSTLRFKLADNKKNWRVLRNIDIILDNLKQEYEEKAQLELLNKVKLLLKFLKGDHGIDIPNHLLDFEQRLRKYFVTEDGLAELKKQEQKDKAKANEESMWFYLTVGAIALAFSIKNQNLVALLIASCCFLAFCLCAYDKFMDGSSSNSTKSNDQLKKYEVFLNFSGSDVRYSLAGLLHSNLEKANICTFFDERSARKSERFLKEIEMAISTSIGAITIFSESYGESEYCLDELVLILEREKAHKGYKIRPIFYDVKPEDLPKPTDLPKTDDLPKPDEPPKRVNKFRQGLKKLSMDVRLKNWEKALTEVVTIGGDVHNSECQHIDELVDKVVEHFNVHVRRSRGR